MERLPLKPILLLALVASVLTLAGCSGSDATATKQEENAYRNPPMQRPEGSMPKGPPPGATK